MSHSFLGILFRFNLILLTALSPQFIFGQSANSLNGMVTDENGKSLSGCSIYLSNTSKGTTSSNNGVFTLTHLPTGKYDLVISAIGFETQIIPVSSDDYPSDLSIKLIRQSTELSAVIVEPVDKDGWNKWGRYFLENFIGKTNNARFCKLENPDALRFRFSSKTNRLTARADEPLRITNQLLGYKVLFELSEFTAYFDDNLVAYVGHPLFTEIDQNDPQKQRNVAENRRKAYRGSLMHFMRAVFEDELEKENFIVRTMISRENYERERVQKIANDPAHPKDSSKYYQKILKQKSVITEMATLSSLEAMTTENSSKSKNLFFNNTMQVIYTGNANKRANVSEIRLETPRAIEVVQNGSYYAPTELVTFKYWGEHEKLCNMLPYDYEP